ncbi:MAG: hypothetical protein RL410_1500 [Actinomycetota bacterium]
MTQRTLEALTDDASLASVSALSLDDFISTGDVSRISLNHVKVLSRVKQIIADSHRPITLEKVLVDVAQVSVQLGMDWTDISGHITRHISAISTANFTPEIDEDANL